MPKGILLKFSLAFVALSLETTSAFTTSLLQTTRALSASPGQKRQPSLPPRNISTGRQRLSSSLKYRELDQDDDVTDPATLKVMSRAPPGFSLKEALQTKEKNNNSPRKQQQKHRSAINGPLIRALSLNQLLIVGLASAASLISIFVTRGSTGIGSLNDIFQWLGGSSKSIFDFGISINTLVWGIGGAIPLLAVSAWIESSDKRAFANINFSTITMCMTLFGRRKAPPEEFLPKQKQGSSPGNFPTTSTKDAAIASFFLSAITGLCEEIVFRRQLPAMLALNFAANGNPTLPFIAQAVLFGLGHVQPGNRLAENGILLGLQTFNGLGFGLIYILSGGDLVSCILAHAAYDFVTFFKTWKDANDQVEYAEQMVSKPLPSSVDNEVQSLQKSDPKIDQRLYNVMKRLFYTFDFDKNESLSLPEVRKGMSYMAIEKAGSPPAQAEIDRLFDETVQTRATEDKDPRLSFADFLRMYSLLDQKKRARAVTQ